MTTGVSPTPEEQTTAPSGAEDLALSQGVEAESPSAGVDADSPSDEGVNKSLVDIARDAITTQAAPSESPTDQVVQEPEPEPETTDEFTDEELGLAPEKDPAEAEREELDNLPFGKHPRFRELIQERNELRSRTQEYEADAGQHRQMREYLDKMELSEEDAARAIILAAQLKHAREGRYDPDKVLQTLTEMQTEIATSTGRALPADIQARVDEGLIDEDSAKELAEARRQRQPAEPREARTETPRADDAARQRIKEFTDTATRWETAVKARDPDFDKKRDAIADYVKVLRTERGNPSNAEEAMVLLRDAYRKVNTQFSKMMPRPEAKKPGLTSDRSHAPESPKSEPKTLLDAARRGLEQARAQSL